LGTGITSIPVTTAGRRNNIVSNRFVVGIADRNINDIATPVANIIKSNGLKMLNINVPLFAFAGTK